MWSGFDLENSIMHYYFSLSWYLGPPLSLILKHQWIKYDAPLVRQNISEWMNDKQIIVRHWEYSMSLDGKLMI